MATVKRVRKPAAKKTTPKAKASAPVNGEIKPIMPGDDGWDSTLKGRRGKPDVVSPVMDPLVDPLVTEGAGKFQLPTGEPFSINQIRNYAAKRNSTLAEEAGVRIRVSGGSNGKNIGVEVVSTATADGDS